mgnify:CR=1 FL=1
MSTNWDRVKEIFATAVDLNPEERRDFLEKSCIDDEELLQEVESLFASDDEVASFMGTLPFEAISVINSKRSIVEKGRRFEHYEIVRLIAAGGMGEVFLALDTRLHRQVAIKLLAFIPRIGTQKLEWFEREAQIVSALNHPNIVTIHDFGSSDDGTFLVTEYVEGETLRNKMNQGSLSVRECLEIVTQIASALSSAHRAGIVHRDVKPENVMVRPDGVVKILDFGIAKLAHNAAGKLANLANADSKTKTGPGMILGTVKYMSPEQARGKDVDARSDIFSLGTVFYEMLTGQAPFEGHSSIDTLSLILHDEPASIGAEPESSKYLLEDIIRKMLAKNRDDRYGSAEELFRALISVEEELRKRPEAQPTSTFPTNTNGTPRAITEDDRNLGATPLEIKRMWKIRGLWFSWRIRVATLILGLVVIGIFATENRSIFSIFSSPSTISSVAILPFVHEDGSPEQDYLTDGITESLINELSQLNDVQIKARSSTFRYKNSQVDPKTIGAELGVNAILKGSVKTVDNGLRVRLELFETRTGDLIWSRVYDRTTPDLISLQSAIVRDVSTRLLPLISPDERRKIERTDTASSEAYRLYLKGRFFWNKRTGPDLKRAIPEFEKAVEVDPTFALAFVGLADSYALLEQYLGSPASETLPKAKAYAQRALEIDETLAEAHTSLGFIHYTMWEWDEADRRFRRAIQLNPNYSTARHWYYVYLRDTGRRSEALEQIKVAIELDPLSLVINVSFCRAHLLIGDTENGIRLARELAELYPNYAPIQTTLGLALIKLGRNDDGLAQMKNAFQLEPSTRSIALLGIANAISGNKDKARSILRELEPKYERRELLGREIAGIYVALGDYDTAFKWLDKDFAAKSSELASITSQQEFDPIRNDPRYSELLKRMNL